MNVNSSFPVEAELPVRHSALTAWVIKRRWFLLTVILPTVLAALYYGLFASDIYISESRFVVKSPDQKKSQVSTLANLVQTTGLSGGQEQTNEVLTYVHSRDALKALERTMVRDKFNGAQIDFLSRFPQPFDSGSFEGLFRYYSKMVSASLDTETSTAIIKVKAFDPKSAYLINHELLDLSEAFVNRLNARAQTKGAIEAQREVDLAAQRARGARLALSQYRNAHGLIDPAKQAVGVLEIANTLTAERAALQAQLDLMQRLTPNNPSIPALRNRVAAISTQVTSQGNRVVGSGNGIASQLGGYENLLVEQDFATQSLNVASAALVQARAEAQHQQFYLERVVDPNIPDDPQLPRRFISVLIIFAGCLGLYFVVWMFMVGVLEHNSDN